MNYTAGRGKAVFALQSFVKKRKERKEPKKFALKEQPQDFIRRRAQEESQSKSQLQSTAVTVQPDTEMTAEKTGQKTSSFAK